jgi:hypothetical protein
MKFATFLALVCSLTLILISSNTKVPMFLYIGVYGLLVSFITMLDIFVFEPKRKKKSRI